MAKIILNEQQFKDYMRILREREKKSNLIKKIVAENMKRMISEEFPDGEEQPVYGIGTMIYKIDSDSVEDYDGMNRDDGDDFETVEDAIATIKYMCSYPEGSVEWDIRYANNWIPLFYIYDKETGRAIDNKIYVSSTDEQYKENFSPIGVKIVVV